MASLRPTLALRGRCQSSAPQWQQLRRMLQGLHLSPKAGSARQLSTTTPGTDYSTTPDEFVAASMGRVRAALQEIGERDEMPGGLQMPKHARALPISPSYFSRQSDFNDSYLTLLKLMRQYAHLPTVPADQVEKAAFRTLKDFRLSAGEHVKAVEYAKAMTLVRRLHKIHPSLAPESVKEAVGKFKRNINPHTNIAKPIEIDRFGRALGVGRRKTSTARAWVVEGTGEVLVNGKSLADAFGRVHDRESAMWPLKAAQRVDKYNVWALVDGGGTTGQAEALTLAIAKALLAHEPALKPVLRRGTSINANTLPLHSNDADTSSSRRRESGSQNRGEEEARPPQGQEEACLGQALNKPIVLPGICNAPNLPSHMTLTCLFLNPAPVGRRHPMCSHNVRHGGCPPHLHGWAEASGRAALTMYNTELYHHVCRGIFA